MTQPPESPQATESGRTALTRDLGHFLMDLSIGLHKHAMYPEGHPSLEPAAEQVIARAAPLLAEKGMLSLGVASNQLVIEGIATDPNNPLLRELAGRLHRHHLGAISFHTGVHTAQVRNLLSVLAIDADRSEKPLGLGPKSNLTAWDHITLYPVTYDVLELLDGESQDDDATDRTRVAQLWIGLARAALTGDEDGVFDDDVEPSTTDPSMVAQAINQQAGRRAYDQVIVGYLLKIAEELRTAKGAEAVALKKRMAQLISTLNKKTLKRLLDMGGDHTQRRQFLLNASEGMAVDAMVELVQAAGAAEEQTISDSLLRMMQKLAQHAETGAGVRRQAADVAVREQMRELVHGWALKDPNPDAYTLALQKMSTARQTSTVSPDARHLPEPRRMLQMALEVDVMGDQVRRAVDQLVANGEWGWVVNTVEEAAAPTVQAGLWLHFGSGETLDRVLATEPIDVGALDLVLSKVGMAAAEPILDALAESESQQTRRLLLDRAIGLGSPLGPLAVVRLKDPRWFVMRNMLNIVAALPQLPAGFDPSEYMRHTDPRVRREAARIAFRDPRRRERAICAAISDADDGIARMGLVAAKASCPPAAIPLLAKKAMSTGIQHQRLAAVQILGETDRRAAIDALIRLVSPQKKLLRTKLPPKTPVLLAALIALRRHNADGRARKALACYARARDPEILQAALGKG